MKTFVLYTLLVGLLLACSKEKHRKWEVREKIFFPGIAFTIVHTDNYSSDTEPFDTVASTAHQIYCEEHILPEGGFRSSDYIKQFGAEISDTLTSFRYEDEEIYTQLKCAVWQFYGKGDDGFYRVFHGYVSGQKSGGEWVIDFDIRYGGKDDKKYRMVRDARYHS